MLLLPIRFVWRGPVILVLLASAPAARSHTLPISTLTLIPDALYLHLELSLNPFELSFFSELDLDKNGRLDPDEFKTADAELTRRLLESLKLTVHDKPIAAEIAGCQPDTESHHLTFRAHYAVDARSASIRIESSLARLSSGSHVTQVTLTRPGSTHHARLDMQSPAAEFEGAELPSPAPGPRPKGLGTPASNERDLRLLLLAASLPVVAALTFLFRHALIKKRPNLNSL